MLVPVQGGVTQLQKRTRPYLEAVRQLATVAIPSLYLFNLGPEPWKGVGGGKEYTIPACPKGARHSVAVEVSMLCLSESDLADGGGNMGTVMDGGLKVANDIIGLDSGSPDLSLYTTNGKWKSGVFSSLTPQPAEEELLAAESSIRQYMLLVYTEGAQRVEQRMKENEDPVLRMKERRLFNRAAVYLGYRPLYGEGEIRLGTCPECNEQISEGANFCKHCHQAIDPASVAMRVKKREREAAKLAKEEPTGEGE